MNRNTLEERIKIELDMDVYSFARAIGVSREMLRTWHNNHKLALVVAISGYKREVLGQH